VQQAAGDLVGGFVGNLLGSTTKDYWDTDTSGITNLAQGAGNVSNAPGITGLTTAQFQAGLPAGFSSTIWGESSDKNGGFPYLLDLPPGGAARASGHALPAATRKGRPFFGMHPHVQVPRLLLKK